MRVGDFVKFNFGTIDAVKCDELNGKEGRVIGRYPSDSHFWFVEYNGKIYTVHEYYLAKVVEKVIFS